MIALASDHVGMALKVQICHHLKDCGIGFRDFGTYSEERCDYPVYAYAAATAVAGGTCSAGILCCGTGVGISIAANKVAGIRCVVCSEPYSAMMSKRHNNTNMLALGPRVVGSGLAQLIVDAWIGQTFEGGRHSRRLEQIGNLERGLAPDGSGGK